jgi:V/A-type H+-transporting ATPase subunit C
MSVVSRYAYLGTRVAVLTERLFQEEALQALIESGTGGDALLNQVGLVGYTLEESQDPALLEQRLLNLFLNDTQILVRPLVGRARDLLVYWVRRYELGNLKAIIRGRAAGRPPAWIREELLDVGAFATLPVEDLLQTEDAAEMLRRLEATPYGDIARQARTIFEERHELFVLDAVVDKRYYAGLNNQVATLPRADQQPLRRLVGVIIDRINLVWLLRYRFVYDLAPAHAYYLLIPAGARLASGQLLALVQRGSPEEVIRHLPPALAAVVGEVTTLAEVEDLLLRETDRIAWIVLRESLFSFARIFAYLVVRERQLHQIHAIIKGKQLRLDAGLIRTAARTAPLSTAMPVH